MACEQIQILWKADATPSCSLTIFLRELSRCACRVRLQSGPTTLRDAATATTCLPGSGFRRGFRTCTRKDPCCTLTTAWYTRVGKQLKQCLFGCERFFYGTCKPDISSLSKLNVCAITEPVLLQPLSTCMHSYDRHAVSRQRAAAESAILMSQHRDRCLTNSAQPCARQRCRFGVKTSAVGHSQSACLTSSVVHKLVLEALHSISEYTSYLHCSGSNF